MEWGVGERGEATGHLAGLAGTTWLLAGSSGGGPLSPPPGLGGAAPGALC